MSRAERMRACLAEAGFIEGRDFEYITPLDSGGWFMRWEDGTDTPELHAAIDKATELVDGRVIPYDEWSGQYGAAAHDERPNT